MLPTVSVIPQKLEPYSDFRERLETSGGNQFLIADRREIFTSDGQRERVNTLSPETSAMAISNDGRYLAYSHKRKLYIEDRQSGSVDQVKLKGKGITNLTFGENNALFAERIQKGPNYFDIAYWETRLSGSNWEMVSTERMRTGKYDTQLTWCGYPRRIITRASVLTDLVKYSHYLCELDQDQNSKFINLAELRLMNFVLASPHGGELIAWDPGTDCIHRLVYPFDKIETTVKQPELPKVAIPYINYPGCYLDDVHALINHQDNFFLLHTRSMTYLHRIKITGIYLESVNFRLLGNQVIFFGQGSNEEFVFRIPVTDFSIQ